jgi:tRNA threonylcarbamoyladenosine biosynthesis protein TsaE
MINKQKILSKSSAETIKFGEQLGRKLKCGDIVCFFGDLGSGKTTLIKGIAKGMRIRQTKVNSPTFVLMNIYQGRLPLFHFDLYRLNDVQEIRSIGYDEFVYDDGVSVIEWADRLGDHLPEEYLKVELKHKTLHERVMIISSIGKRYEKIYKSLN